MIPTNFLNITSIYLISGTVCVFFNPHNNGISNNALILQMRKLNNVSKFIYLSSGGAESFSPGLKAHLQRGDEKTFLQDTGTQNHLCMTK